MWYFNNTFKISGSIRYIKNQYPDAIISLLNGSSSEKNGQKDIIPIHMPMTKIKKFKINDHVTITGFFSVKDSESNMRTKELKINGLTIEPTPSPLALELPSYKEDIVAYYKRDYNNVILGGVLLNAEKSGDDSANILVKASSKSEDGIRVTLYRDMGEAALKCRAGDNIAISGVIRILKKQDSFIPSIVSNAFVRIPQALPGEETEDSRAFFPQKKEV